MMSCINTNPYKTLDECLFVLVKTMLSKYVISPNQYKGLNSGTMRIKREYCVHVRTHARTYDKCKSFSTASLTIARLVRSFLDMK